MKVSVYDMRRFLGMVANGANVLMATSEKSSSNGAQNNTTRLENQNVCSRYNEMHYSEQNAECLVKKNITSCAVNSKCHRIYEIKVTCYA